MDAAAAQEPGSSIECSCIECSSGTGAAAFKTPDRPAALAEQPAPPRTMREAAAGGVTQ